MSKEDTNLLGTLRTIGIIAGIGALCSVVLGKDQKRDNAIDRTICDLSKWGASALSSRPIVCDTMRANTIVDELEELEIFDGQLIKLITDLDLVVTHISSEHRYRHKPYVMLGISSSNMPAFVKYGLRGEVHVPETYQDFVNPDNIIERAIDRYLDGRDISYIGVSYRKSPGEFLSLLYLDLAPLIRIYICNPKPSRMSSIGCSGIEIDDDPDADNEFKWTSASASNLRNIEEVFFEISIDRSIMDKDLFHIAQILIKAELATIIEYHIDE